jgi:hypothetical protein
MLRQVDRFSDGRVVGVVVVDQNRRDRAALESLPRVTQVVEFEPDAGCTALLGHDHPVALNRVMRGTEFTSSHVLLLDSDCFPVDRTWLDRLDDITLATVSRRDALTHPCFMAFPAPLAPFLDFFEGVNGAGFDTGRLIGLQMSRTGHEFAMTRPASRRAFGNTRGTWYLDGSVYHHGNASFVSSGSRMVRRQVVAVVEERYRRHIAKGSFRLDPTLAAMVFVQLLSWWARGRLAGKPLAVRAVRAVKRAAGVGAT